MQGRGPAAPYDELTAGWAERVLVLHRGSGLELPGPRVKWVKIDRWVGAMRSYEWARGEGQVGVPREASTCLSHSCSAFIPAQIDVSVTGGLGKEHRRFCISVRRWLWR